MGRTPNDVTDAELEILQVLWRDGALTIRTVTEVLNPEQVESYYSTVKKLLERLERKGFVRREREGMAHLYEPVVNRDELIGRRLQKVAETLCEGSVSPLLTQLAQHHELNTSQQEQLMALIDDLAGQKEAKSNSNRGRRR